MSQFEYTTLQMICNNLMLLLIFWKIFYLYSKTHANTTLE